MKAHRTSWGLLLGYHGCDRALAERILSGKDELRESAAKQDWLGPGIYFWVDSPRMALGWAFYTHKSEPMKINDPYVIGAYISPGLCLNLTDLGAMASIRSAYQKADAMFNDAGGPMPENERDPKSGEIRWRYRDCAVLQILHQLRADQREQPYDSVFGVFEAGPEIFPGSALRLQTHMQIAVRSHNDHANILGYFRVPGLDEMITEIKGRQSGIGVSKKR